MSQQRWIQFCLAVSAASYLLGRGVTASSSAAPIRMQPDARQPVATVAIAGIRDGLAYGEVHGNARVLIGGNMVAQTGAFRVPAGPLLIHEVSVIVPEWARYVASSRGTKYYSVGSKSAERLSPQNRVYFKSAEAAEGAGYRF